MRSKLAKLAFVAAIGLVLALTFSCSGGDEGGNGNSFEYGSFLYQDKTYKTIKIGDQVWMAENLNYDVSGSKCYDDDPANCAKYGRLYAWVTAMALPDSCNHSSCSIGASHQGICPSGWHISSDDEWTTLKNFVGTNPVTKLKSTSDWSYNGNGKDTYGFAALPSGYAGGFNGPGSDKWFSGVGISGGWWTASEYENLFVYVWSMIYGNENFIREDYSKDYNLYSIRCVQN